MLIIVLAVSVATSVIVAMRRRDLLSLYLLGMSVSNSAMLTGVVVYIAKMGGTAAQQRVILFLMPAIQSWIMHLPVSMSKIGYLVAIGRSLFPLFAMLDALEANMNSCLRRRRRGLRLLACIMPLVSLVFYYPGVFRTVVRGRFWLLPVTMRFSIVWILLYLAASVLLMWGEYRATTIRVCKKQFGYLLLSFVSTALLYLIYATKDPAQIYNMFMSEYIRLGVNGYISPALPAAGWWALGITTICMVLLGSYGVLRYTLVNYDEEQQDLLLQRKFDTAGTGVSVFVHGIKNQLLSSRVLHKKLERALGSQPPDIEEARAVSDQLGQLDEAMLERMDELYRTVKTNVLSLTPVPVETVAEASVKRFHGKYPDVEVRLEGASERLVLADVPHLSEAVYNLLTNGYEAAVQAGREHPEVALVFHDERLWTVMEVRDNGGGIPKNKENKIYEPFYTSKNTNYNWGMGLYYVRKIVKSHFGILRLESREGEGSSFFVMLPLFGTGR